MPESTGYWQRMLGGLKHKTEFLQLVSVGNQGVLSLIGLLRVIIVVRLLSPEDYGMIGITLAVGGLFTVFLNLGLSVGAAKEAAKNNDPNRLAIISLLILLVRFAILLPLLLLLVFVAAPVADDVYAIDRLTYYIYLYALFVFLSAPGDILNNVLSGASQFKAFFKLRLLNEILVSLAVIGFILTNGLAGYFYGQALAALFYSLISFNLVWRLSGRQMVSLSRLELNELLRSVMRTSMSAFVAKLSRGFSLQIPVLLAGLWFPIHQVGWLKFGMQAGGYVATLIAAAQVVSLPRMIQAMKDSGQAHMLQKFILNYRRLIFFIALVMVSTVSLGPELIYWVAGESFMDASRPFQLIVIYYGLIVAADMIFVGVYFPLNREDWYVRAYLVNFLCSVSLTLVFLNYFQTLASVLYGLVVAAGLHFLFSVFAISKINLDPRVRVLQKLLVYGLWFFLLLILVMLNSLIEVSLLRVLVGGGLCVLVIMLLLKHDYQVLRGLLDKVGAGH